MIDRNRRKSQRGERSAFRGALLCLALPFFLFGLCEIGLILFKLPRGHKRHRKAESFPSPLVIPRLDGLLAFVGKPMRQGAILPIPFARPCLRVEKLRHRDLMATRSPEKRLKRPCPILRHTLRHIRRPRRHPCNLNRLNPLSDRHKRGTQHFHTFVEIKGKPLGKRRIQRCTLPNCVKPIPYPRVPIHPIIPHIRRDILSISKRRFP